MRSRTPSASAGIAGIRLVSITVDPEHDDPKHLRAYATEICADPARWTLLAGDLEAIRRLRVRRIPRAGRGAAGAAGGLFDIAHSGKFVLVDGKGAIRGYCDTDEWGSTRSTNRAQQVLREAGARL